MVPRVPPELGDVVAFNEECVVATHGRRKVAHHADRARGGQVGHL